MNRLNISSTSQKKSAISSSDNVTMSYLLGKMERNREEGNEADLHVACDKKNHEALDLLLSKTDIDVNVKDKNGKTPLYKSCESNNLYAVGKLLDRPEIDVNAKANLIQLTPLHVACIHNNLEVVDKLLQSPVIDVNSKTPIGRTPLHCACLKNLPFIVQKLLASPGIDVNARDAEGLTPLMDCIKWCSEDALKVLLEDPRVNLSIKDREGKVLKVEAKTPRYFSCLELRKTERMRRDTEAVEQRRTERLTRNSEALKQELTSQAGSFAEGTVPKLLGKMDTEEINRKVDGKPLNVLACSVVQPCPTPGWTDLSTKEKLSHWIGLSSIEQMRPKLAELSCSFLPEGNPRDSGDNGNSDNFICTGCTAEGASHDLKCNCEIKKKEPEPEIIDVEGGDEEIFPSLGPYQCEICQQITETKQEFVAHIKYFHKDMVDEAVLRSLESDLKKRKKKEAVDGLEASKKNKTYKSAKKKQKRLWKLSGDLAGGKKSSLTKGPIDCSVCGTHLQRGTDLPKHQQTLKCRTAAYNIATIKAAQITEGNAISSKDHDEMASDVAGNDKHDEALDLPLAETVIESGEVGQEQTSRAGSIGRHNVKIEKINKEIGIEEGKHKTNMDMRKQKMEDLVKKYEEEMEDLKRKHKEESSLLEKNQKHGITVLQDTLAKEDHEEQRYIARLKEHRDELAQELETLTNDSSSEERSKLGCVQEISEVQNVNNFLEQEMETVKKSEEEIGVLMNKLESIHQEEMGQNQINEISKDKEQKKEKKTRPFCSLASCLNRGRHKCSRCKAVYYCHDDCLSEDWPYHKMFCDYVYKANKVPQDFTGKNPSDIENTSCREEVE